MAKQPKPMRVSRPAGGSKSGAKLPAPTPQKTIVPNPKSGGCKSCNGK